MNRITFCALALLFLALASVLVGIRGVENWAIHETAVYFFMIGWIVRDAYHRFVLPAPGRG